MSTGQEPGRQLDAEILAVPPSRLAQKSWLVDLLAFVFTRDPSHGGTETEAKVVVRYRDRERLLFKEPTFDGAKAKVERVATEFER